MLGLRWGLFFIGLMFFSFGISLTIEMQHLGVHPWDVLNVALQSSVGLTIGSWNVIIGVLLIGVAYVLDKSYIKIGTFLNAIVTGSFVDFFLWSGILPTATHTWTDILFLLAGIVIMGIGGGIYNAGGVGSGPRDGFMLSISDKLDTSIGKVRIVTELGILLVGFLLGGPIFIFTFIFTFIQSPIFQATYTKLAHVIDTVERKTIPSEVSHK